MAVASIINSDIGVGKGIPPHTHTQDTMKSALVAPSKMEMSPGLVLYNLSTV